MAVGYIYIIYKYKIYFRVCQSISRFSLDLKNKNLSQESSSLLTPNMGCCSYQPRPNEDELYQISQTVEEYILDHPHLTMPTLQQNYNFHRVNKYILSVKYMVILIMIDYSETNLAIPGLRKVYKEGT